MTAPGSGSTRSGLLRALLLAASGLCVLAVAGWLALRAEDAGIVAPPAIANGKTAAAAAVEPVLARPTTPAASAATAIAKPPPAASPMKLATIAPPPAPSPPPVPRSTAAPSFDIVRISPQGDAVVAGRAAAGATVTLESNGKPIASTTANAAGQFVILPDRPLAPGGRELTLSARTPGGRQEVGRTPVIVAIPGAPPPAAPRPELARATPSAAAPAQPLVVLAPPGAAPRVLQGAGTAAKGKGAPLGLGAVDYGAGGELHFAGRAPPGSVIRLYINNHAVAEAAADAHGHWTARPAHPVAPGTYTLRLDRIAPGTGKVLARVELPFQRADLGAQPPAAGAPGADRIVIQPTQNLWRIARRVYGHGIRYIDIYNANRGQIRDPNLIYPGQVFTLPAAAASAAK